MGWGRGGVAEWLLKNPIVTGEGDGAVRRRARPADPTPPNAAARPRPPGRAGPAAPLSPRPSPKHRRRPLLSSGPAAAPPSALPKRHSPARRPGRASVRRLRHAGRRRSPPGRLKGDGAAAAALGRGPRGAAGGEARRPGPAQRPPCAAPRPPPAPASRAAAPPPAAAAAAAGSAAAN